MDEPLPDPDPDGRAHVSGPRAGGAGDLILRGADRLAAALRAVARAPLATALFCDIDGTISPIVSDPYKAIVPEPFRAALAALAPHLGLLAFVTGRDVRQAAAMVGVDGASYVGLHGFDLMASDGTVVRDPSAEPYVDKVQSMAGRVGELDAERLGLVVENKGPMLDLHYRQSADPAATLAVLEAEILGPARELGLAIATGHFLVELRPPVPLDKGTAVLRLLRAGGRGAVAPHTAIFVGDDLTDCTGFAAVHDWAGEVAEAGARQAAATAGGHAPAGRVALAVAALTDETPQEVKDGSDVWVAATPGVDEVLTRLLGVTGTPSGREGGARGF
jgi:trehalose 6-phosphate phosphatase